MNKLTNKTYNELSKTEYQDVKDDIYWTLEGYFGKFRARALINTHRLTQY